MKNLIYWIFNLDQWKFLIVISIDVDAMRQQRRDFDVQMIRINRAD